MKRISLAVYGKALIVESAPMMSQAMGGELRDNFEDVESVCCQQQAEIFKFFKVRGAAELCTKLIMSM